MILSNPKESSNCTERDFMSELTVGSRRKEGVFSVRHTEIDPLKLRMF